MAFLISPQDLVTINRTQLCKKSLKKNLQELAKALPNAALYFFDESRFGTHSKLGFGWFEKGTRPRVNVKLGFQNFYVYGAVNPTEGSHISLFLPKVNTKCMNIFLAEMSTQLAEGHAILVLDGARWHRSKHLQVPANITLLFLPPYSPELNPIERLWNYIKRHTIKNHVYESLDALITCISNFLCSIPNNTISSICNAEYLFN